MASGLIDARWVAPFEGELPDRTVLVSNETVVKVGRDEAESSANWEPVHKAKPKSKQEASE